MSEPIIVTLKRGNDILGIVTLEPIKFKTKSSGFFAQSKLHFDGERYQTQIQLVEIGSKNAAEQAGAADRDPGAQPSAVDEDRNSEVRGG